MNTSAISAYDNVTPREEFSKSGMYSTINDLLNINGGVDTRIFCPLCVNSFEFKFSLFEHLRTFHNNFLIEANNQNIRFKECPFCDAKFYGKHLTAKHALLHHTKVIRELFLSKKSGKCFFCEEKPSKSDVGNHIEEFHFLDFEEEFRKMFSCDNSLEMTMAELINSSIQDEGVKWEDVCMDIGKRGFVDSNIQDFDEASRINCFDFTDLKEQLENMKDFQTDKNPESANKSILKDIRNLKNIPGPQKSVRRVLRFDIPHQDDENKENSVLKQIGINEHNLDKYFNKTNDSWCGEPQHSSTPNKPVGKILVKDDNRRKKLETFKSYITKPTEFEFECGKCKKLFKENLELVSHIKNNHRKLSLNVWQPCYRCAICSARFYKNYYLRKHHKLHKP